MLTHNEVWLNTVTAHYSCGRGACNPLHIPLADSVMLSTVRRLRGTIFAPEESSSSWTFFSIPVTSKSLRPMTLSRLLTVEVVRGKRGHRVEYTYYRNHGQRVHGNASA